MEKKVCLLSAQKICKSFGRNTVLKNVDFDLEKGEVHALIGENGAGKSTLLKILFGIYQPTSGEILLNGSGIRMKRPVDAIGEGIAMIHQEPSVFEDLSIAENIFTGHFEKRRIRWEDLNRRAGEAMQQVGLSFHPGRKMKGLSVAEQQLIEIAAALSSDAKIIFMDEPTASLTPGEVDNLLALIDELRKMGKTIVYISHRLDEIKAVSDRITVLRDGEIVGTYQNAELTKDQIIQKMIGKELRPDIGNQGQRTFGRPYLEVQDISIPGVFEHVSFETYCSDIFFSLRVSIDPNLFFILSIIANVVLNAIVSETNSPNPCLSSGTNAMLFLIAVSGESIFFSFPSILISPDLTGVIPKIPLATSVRPAPIKPATPIISPFAVSDKNRPIKS